MAKQSTKPKSESPPQAPAETPLDAVSAGVATDAPAQPSGAAVSPEPAGEAQEPGPVPSTGAAAEPQRPSEPAAASADARSPAGAADMARPEAELSPEINRILSIEVPVIVKLAEKRLPLGDILGFLPGAIVEFEKNAAQPLDLLVHNKTIGHGVAVKVGEKFGLRVDEILPVSETIRKLGN